MFDKGFSFEEKINKSRTFFKYLKIGILSLLLLFGAFRAVQFCLFDVYGWQIYLSILFVVVGCWFMFEPFNKITEFYLLKEELSLLFAEENSELFPIKFNSNFVEESSLLLNLFGYHKNIDVITKTVYISKGENINKRSYYCIYESCVNSEYIIAVCTNRANKLNIINDIKIQDFAQNAR